MKNLFKEKQNGITLIALVITIIVLLILAGVSIAMLTGDNGILTQASKSKMETEIAEVKEQAKLDIMAWRTEELAKGNAATLDEATVKSIITGKDYVNELGETSFTTENGYEILYSELYSSKTTGENQAVVGEIVTGSNKDYTNNGTAVIPVGFAIVPGLEDISEGLVISDVENDTGNIGNQFVWIPVSKENFATEFVIRAGYFNGRLSDISNYGEADSTGTNTKITESATTQEEAKEMYASVLANGGFYIGRYEAGVEGVELESSGSSSSGSSITVEKVVVKKGADVYNNIIWGTSMTVEAGGAVELARNFDTENNYTSVTSTLCYSVQWDTALNFIDPGYTGYTKNSTGMGWYSDNYNSTTNGNTETNPDHITGKDLIYTSSPTVIANKQKNIYDMGGNVWEWTMEAYDAEYRAYRGGYDDNAGFYGAGSEFPASSRGASKPTNSFNYVGFRLALYL